MGDDPRLPAMPEKPTLMDFFKYRFGPAAHLLQSARHAVKAGLPEKMVLACLLHDISTIGFIRGDHGYWGAQLVEPYVDEEVTWAIRAHQVLRFYPDESVGYEYPQSYIKTFGADYRPDPYVEEDYQRMRNHKWYMSGRMITVHDIYSFDPDVMVELEEFTDVIGRNFRQPEQGLGLRQQPGRAYVAGDDPAGEVSVEGPALHITVPWPEKAGASVIASVAKQPPGESVRHSREDCFAALAVTIGVEHRLSGSE